MPGHDGWVDVGDRDFRSRCRKTMHAEHADGTELNELSGQVICCAFTVLNTLGVGFL